MKYAMIALISMFSISASADCNTQVSAEQATEQMVISTDVPSHLKGATVCVRLATGKESCVPAEKFKVVPRKQQFIVTKTERSQVTTCSAEQRKNRVSLHAGKGPNGHLDRDTNAANTHTEIKAEHGVIGAAQYQRMLNDRWSVSGQLQSSELKNIEGGLLGLGYDF